MKSKDLYLVNLRYIILLLLIKMRYIWRCGMSDKIFEMMLLEQQKVELQCVLASNEKTKQFGVALTEEEAQMLITCRRDVLKNERRVEFGEGILPKLIDAFCDSQYVEKENYADTLAALQEVFYLYKNESMDELTDDELISFMREQFDGVCYGSIEYLGETCLERFIRAVRAGYEDYKVNDNADEYNQFSEEKHWDHKLYLESLWDLLS